MKGSFDVLHRFLSPFESGKKPEDKSDKDPLIALFFSIFFGWAGLDHLYLERLDGILKLVTLGGVGAWWVFDIINILRGKMRDGDGKLLGAPSIM
jgi:TM2 domain-containing membrane protein YozV